VVSAYARRPLTPRGQRTQALVRSLERDWEVELIALPEAPDTGNGGAARGKALWRRAAGGVVRAVLLDRFEPWSARTFLNWRPQSDAALLVGYPWSPVTRAAARLRSAGVPYVVDSGDPWEITKPYRSRPLPSEWRARRLEPALWRGAAGAVVTTPQQRDRLQEHFPDLPMLVRPNGYDLPDGAGMPDGAGPRQPRDPGSLRIAHFGMLLNLRVDVVPFLVALARSGRWTSITFEQFGHDFAGTLDRVPPEVHVVSNPARPWAEVMARASEFDAALVVGNRVGIMLPSKAIQYLTLPIPRIALPARRDDDPLFDYVSERPAWLAVTPEDPDLAERVWEHVNADWSAADLSPPAGEAWPAVADEVSDFIGRCVAVERA